MPEYYPLLLTILYGAAWVWASFSPMAGLLFFAIISLVVSLPSLLPSCLARILLPVVMGILLSVLVTAVPILGIPCGIGFFLFGLFLIAGKILRNLLLILAAETVYCLLFFAAPSRSYLSSLTTGDHGLLWTALLVLMSALILQVVFLVLRLFGYRTSRVAAFILGFVGFNILLVWSVFNLFGGGDRPDGSDLTAFDWHGHDVGGGHS